jgi:hypothetical protein
METNTLPLEKELEPIFTKQLPAFPDNIKDLFVKIAPFLAIIGVVFGVLGVGVTALLSPFAWFAGSFIYGLGMIFLLIMVILDALAIPGLFAQKMQGWKYMYYAQFLSLIYSLCMGNWFSGLLGAFIGFWILFQIREKYS